MRGCGIRLEARFQCVHTCAELRQVLLETVYIGLDCCWGVLPILRHKGKWPSRADEVRQRLHTFSTPQSTATYVCAVYSGKGPTGSSEKRLRRAQGPSKL